MRHSSKGRRTASAPGKDESAWRVVEFDVPRRQRHVGEVPFLGEINVEMDLVPRGDATEFRHAIGYRAMPGAMRPIGWLIERIYVDRYARSRMEQTHAAANVASP